MIFGILTVITSVFTFCGFASSVCPDSNISKEISLILIPIVAGGIVTKFTTDSWQITKEKLRIKRDILSEYETSYKLIANLSDNFLNRVIESYIIYKAESNAIPFDSYTNPVMGITAFLKFPEENHQPIKKFEDEYNELTKKLDDASITQNKLLSSIRLYYGNKELETSLNEILKILNDRLDILRRLMFSEKPEDLENYFKIYEDKTKTVKEKIRDVENKIIELKFSEINL